MPFFLLYFLSLGTFVFLKILNAGVRLSDTNIYFYTAYQLLQGKLLYRDIFFTNLPIFPYISSLYFLLTGGSIILYYLTPAIEITGTTLLLFFILKEKTKSSWFAFLMSLFYPFSFIVLVTSTHQTGVFLTAFFATLAYYLLIKKRYLFSGVILALAVLTKAYVVPVALALFVAVFIQDRKKFLSVFIPFLTTTIVCLLPFALFAKREILSQVVGYSLTRAGGIDKWGILKFAVPHDIVLSVFFLYLFALPKKNPLLFLTGLLSTIFYIFYQDLYYLYLNVFVPFIVLGAGELYRKQLFEKYKIVIGIFIVLLSAVNILWYTNSFANIQAISDFQAVVERVKKEEPKVIYGTNDIAPAISYETGIPLLNNIIDTNENIYRKKILSAKKLTQRAVAQKALLVGHGLYRPDKNIDIQLADEIFDEEMVKKHCKFLERYPVIDERGANVLTLFTCQ